MELIWIKMIQILEMTIKCLIEIWWSYKKPLLELISVLVFVNGVAQIGGTNFTVDGTGANIVFAAGDEPTSVDTIHIVELPI